MSPDLSPYLPQSSDPPKACFSEYTIPVEREKERVRKKERKVFIPREFSSKSNIIAFFNSQKIPEKSPEPDINSFKHFNLIKFNLNY